MASLKLTESIIRQHTTPESFQRGLDYYKQGAVISVIRRGDQILAEVEGSQYEPYQVRITLDEGGIVKATCSCPYDWGGWCKHIVATLLTCMWDPEKVQERLSPADLVASLSQDQLRELVLWLVGQMPSLVDSLESWVQRLQARSVPTPEGKSARRQTIVDPTPYRRRVQALIRSADYRRGYEGYGQVSEVLGELGEILDEIRQFVEAGDGQNALILLDAVTDEYAKRWHQLDDYDGEASGFFSDLGAVWVEALLTADLTREEREEWARKLKKWQRELSDYGEEEAFEVAIAAALQGWDYPPLVRVLQGEITSQGAWEGEAPWYADDLAVARLNILERQGRYQEYLYLAEAEGQTEQYLTMLVRLGRVQEAVDYALQYMASAQEALALAKALRERQEFRLALRVAERGLSLGGQKEELASWLAELAMMMGEIPIALNAATVAFRERPALVTYLRVKEMALEKWPEIQPNLLAYLEDKGGVSDKVDVYLHEGLVERAVRAVDKSPYVPHAVVEQVVDAALKTHPDWVIRQCIRQAEDIIERGQSRYYSHAVEWLKKARAAYYAAGREAEWQAYFQALVSRHGRKYSLMPLLQQIR